MCACVGIGRGIRKKGRSSQRIPSIINNLNITFPSASVTSLTSCTTCHKLYVTYRLSPQIPYQVLNKVPRMHMRGRQLKTIFVPKLSIYALLYRLTLSEIYPLVFPLQVLHGGIPFIARLSRFNCLHGFTSEAFKTFLVMGALSTPAFLYAPAYVILKGFLLSLSVPYQRHFRVFFIAFFTVSSYM